ncbi:MAG: FHA domain-containing protein [Blastocatellia bacterium]|nr:FHA domain-containing protein [Blastocatellia bacterium]
MEFILCISEGTTPRRILLTHGSYTLGTASDVEIGLDDPDIEPRHARLEIQEAAIRLIDCASESGVFLNGRQVRGSVSLKSGDLLRLGDSVEMTIQGNQSVPLHSSHHVEGSKPKIPKLFFQIVAAGLAGIFCAGCGWWVMNHWALPRPPSQVLAIPLESNEPSVVESLPSVAEPAEPVNPIRTTNPEATATEIRKALRQISNDPAPAFVSPEVQADITSRIERFRRDSRASGLVAGLQADLSFQRYVREQNLEPRLVAWLLAAEGVSAEPGTIVRETQRVCAQLRPFKERLGVETTDSVLLLLAVYRVETISGNGKQLAGRIERAVESPMDQRTIWYLRKVGVIGDDVVSFIHDILAIGVVGSRV